MSTGIPIIRFEKALEPAQTVTCEALTIDEAIGAYGEAPAGSEKERAALLRIIELFEEEEEE